jgi:hypothetical protein
VPGVAGHGQPGQVQHVPGVIAHEVMQPTVVIMPQPLVEVEELIKEQLGLAAVAHAKLGHVQLLRQRPGRGQPVPHPEQPGDQIARRGRVASIATYLFPFGCHGRDSARPRKVRPRAGRARSRWRSGRWIPRPGRLHRVFLSTSVGSRSVMLTPGRQAAPVDLGEDAVQDECLDGAEQLVVISPTPSKLLNAESQSTDSGVSAAAHPGCPYSATKGCPPGMPNQIVWVRRYHGKTLGAEDVNLVRGKD